MQIQPVSSDEDEEVFQLFHLPDPVLDLILQRLDQCSLACTALTCKPLSHAVPASMRIAAVRCSTIETRSSFLKHSPNLTNLEQCSLVIELYKASGLDKPHLPSLPSLPLLRQLHLEGWNVQLGPAGVLQQCSGLTALHLQSCVVQDVTAAAAAIAALPKLQHLRLEDVSYMQEGRSLLAELRFPLQLTHLSFNRGMWLKPSMAANLSQLSRLVNLRELKLDRLSENNPLPSQLVELTCLEVKSNDTISGIARHLHHLGSLTALQQLSIGIMSQKMSPHTLSSIQHLPQLTCLELKSIYAWEFSTTTTQSWACLTVLQSLSLRYCRVHPEVLSKVSQLRALSLKGIPIGGAAPLERLLAAVSQLTSLTKLLLHIVPEAQFLARRLHHPATPFGAEFTSLTASSNLTLFSLDLRNMDIPQDFELFGVGAVRSHLREINLSSHGKSSLGAVPFSEQQLQRLCNCCPNVKSLAFAPQPTSSPAALLPLLQLSKLTSLEVHNVDAAAAGVLAAAEQLTGLKHLTLGGIPHLWDWNTWDWNTWVSLTSLTSLQELQFAVGIWHGSQLRPKQVRLRSKARWFGPSDVWMQLRSYLSA